MACIDIYLYIRYVGISDDIPMRSKNPSPHSATHNFCVSVQKMATMCSNSMHHYSGIGKTFFTRYIKNVYSSVDWMSRETHVCTHKMIHTSNRYLPLFSFFSLHNFFFSAHTHIYISSSIFHKIKSLIWMNGQQFFRCCFSFRCPVTLCTGPYSRPYHGTW